MGFAKACSLVLRPAPRIKVGSERAGTRARGFYAGRQYSAGGEGAAVAPVTRGAEPRARAVDASPGASGEVTAVAHWQWGGGGVRIQAPPSSVPPSPAPTAPKCQPQQSRQRR